MLVDADYLGTNFGNLWVLLKSLKTLTADLLGIMLDFFLVAFLDVSFHKI